MRRLSIIILLFAVKVCSAQEGWQFEIMPGVAVYRGDLTQGAFNLKSVGPGVVANIKYDFGDMVVLRGGIGWGKLSADDNKSKSQDIRTRNLNFKTSVIELGFSAEFNILDPEAYWSYPYLMTGIGAFHFNPFANDLNNKKTFLRPLSTEGQGFPEYPDRKPYSLTQVYLPFGGGWKINVRGEYAISFEMGVRYTFTDYLDDVSKTYINKGVLFTRKGQKAVDLAYRQSPASEGEQRGNSNVKDLYFMSGFKLTYYLNKKKKTIKKFEIKN